MIRRFALLFALLLLPAGLRADGEVCPCVPLSHTWIVTACETWNCAQSAMILANGDPVVISAPTGGSKYRWVILKQVVSGSAVVSPEDPFLVEPFTSASAAAARYSVLGPEMLPIMLTTVDGSTLVLSLRHPDTKHRRAVAH